MIKVNVRKNHFEIKGHAMYDDSGRDIVCAAVSAIAITTINAILKFDNEALHYFEKDGYLKVDILKASKANDLLILNMIGLMKELEEKYPKNIKVNEEV